jgi:GT2 family glycosyltransferase
VKLSIIVVNYNSWPDVLLQANSFHSSNKTDGMELVVVDNASTAVVPTNRSNDARIKWLDLAENGGFAAGVNAGVRAAAGEWLLLLNPDVTLEAETLAQVMQLINLYNSQKDIGVIGVKLTNPDGGIQASAGPFPSFHRIFKEAFMAADRRRYAHLDPEKCQQVDWVTGAFMLIRRDVFEAVGGFCEDYFLYFEETDFCHQVRKIGFHTVYDPSISVCHRHPLQNRATPPIIRIYTRHSRMLFFQRNRPRWESISMIAMVYLEAQLRSLLSLIRGDHAYRHAWSCIVDICKLFAAKNPPLGISVRKKAEMSLKTTAP